MLACCDCSPLYFKPLLHPPPSPQVSMLTFPNQPFWRRLQKTIQILSSSVFCSWDVKRLQWNTGKGEFWRFTPPRRFVPRSAIKLPPIFDLPTTCTLLCYSKPSIIIKLKLMALNFSNIYSPASQWDVNNKKSEGLLHLFLLYINELGSLD